MGERKYHFIRVSDKFHRRCKIASAHNEMPMIKFLESLDLGVDEPRPIKRKRGDGFELRI